MVPSERDLLQRKHLVEYFRLVPIRSSLWPAHDPISQLHCRARGVAGREWRVIHSRYGNAGRGRDLLERGISRVGKSDGSGSVGTLTGLVPRPFHALSEDL